MRRLPLAALFVVFLAIGTGAFAQQPPWSEQLPAPQPPNYGRGTQGPISGPGPNINAPTDDGSAPDRGVARLGYMSGNVSVRRGDTSDLVAASINAPLVAGDRVVTADTGKAEIQFDGLNLIRLGPATEVRLSELGYHRYQVQIATGVTMFRVVRDNDAQVEISTPSVAVRPLRSGVYRISVLPDGSSQITVRLGEAEVFSPRGSEPLQAGKTMMARGSADDPEFQMIDPVGNDEFESWCVFRDRQMQPTAQATSPSARYMGPDAAGAQDLDANGRWVNDPSNGNVWVPANVDPGWAPYSCGRWVWTDFYGWTWVGCESWGWAPYHYGRWFYGSYGWAWAPGVVIGRPYYWRPALVGFFGWGGGVGLGFGFGFGNIGWVPLGPGEFFHPWYGRGFYGGFGGVNVVSVNAINSFRNARFTNAVSSVRAGDFGHGSVNGSNIVRPQAGELAHAGAVHGQLPVSPTRESTQFSGRAASAQGLPHTSDNARFASHMQAASTSHVSFEQQRQSFSQAASRGRNVDSGRRWMAARRHRRIGERQCAPVDTRICSSYESRRNRSSPRRTAHAAESAQLYAAATGAH